MAKKISVQIARKKIMENSSVLFVIAYKKEKYDAFHLEGSIPREDFEAKAPTLPKDAEIIFY